MELIDPGEGHGGGVVLFAPVPGRARRRSQELAELSRHHHQALLQAIALKRARLENAHATRDAFLEFWDGGGNAHFVEEETELLPRYAQVADPGRPAVVRMLLEHVLIRARVIELRERADPPVPGLKELGRWLEVHVRHEERVVFPMIEDATGMSVQ